MTVRQRKALKSKPRPVDRTAAADTFLRDGMTCQWCKVPGGKLVPHHRLRRSQGGRDVPAHLVSVHPLCHMYIHDHPAEAGERGFLVRSEDALKWGWS
jgi:5-methylcytosine-specific restriction endonuclease McrA